MTPGRVKSGAASPTSGVLAIGVLLGWERGWSCSNASRSGGKAAPLRSMRAMDAHEWARIDRLERQVTYLLNHLEIDPDVAAGQAGSAFGPASASTFGSASDIFGTPAAAPSATSPPSAFG